MFGDNATTSRTLRNVKRALEHNLKTKYGIEDEEIVNKFLSIHGLNKSRFDFVNSIEQVIHERLNDVSIDANSNKNEKTVEAIQQEAFAPVKKSVGYDYLYRQMKVLFGKDEARRLSGEMYDLSLGLSDSTNILKPYCFSIDASKIVVTGRPFGQLRSKPAKRVSSYISALCETIHQLSSHLAGAIAVGTFFLDVAHLSLYKEGCDLRELKTNRKYRKKIENEFQQFVHSVNHLSRNGMESPFTNISVFDRTKMRTLLSDMAWYFPFEDLPIDHPSEFGTDEQIEQLADKIRVESLKNGKEERSQEDYESTAREQIRRDFYMEYIIDYISEVQDIFLRFFDKGDPTKNGSPYRFPVVTLNLGKKKRGSKEIIEDTKFLKKVCKLDIFRYNIFVSEGTKIASCCRLLSNSEMLEYAAQSNSFGAGGSVSLGSHRVCTVNFMRIAMEAGSREEFFEILGRRVDDAAKILKAHKDLITKLKESGLQPFMANGWINPKRLFSTFGILGIYEASKIFKGKFGNGYDIEGEILRTVNDHVASVSEKYGIIGNIEQIPGESFAVRLAASDKLIYGEKAIPFNLYSNQFIPLWEDATLWEKLDADGRYNKLITGGGIVHAQIGEKVTARQAGKIIRYAVNAGSEHFALNAIYSECENEHTSFGKHSTCPVCSAEITEMYTRVVGFFTPVSSWQNIRREWEFPRRTFIDLNKED